MLDTPAYRLTPVARATVRQDIGRDVISRLLAAEFWNDSIDRSADNLCCGAAPMDVYGFFEPYLLSRELIESAPPILPSSWVGEYANTPVLSAALKMTLSLRGKQVPSDIAELSALNAHLRGGSTSSFRTKAVVVQNSEDLRFPPSGALHGLVRMVFQYAARNRTAAGILAATVALGLIHPFSDGNGRVTRAFSLLSMRNANTPQASRLIPVLVLGCRRKFLWPAVRRWVVSGSGEMLISILDSCRDQAQKMHRAIAQDIHLHSLLAASGSIGAGPSSYLGSTLAVAESCDGSAKLGADSGARLYWDRDINKAMDRHVAHLLSFS